MVASLLDMVMHESSKILTAVKKATNAFSGVLKKTLGLFIILLLPLLGFVLAFSTLVQQNKDFRTFPRSFVRTMFMLLGELNFADIIWPEPDKEKGCEQEDVPFYTLTLFILILFLLIMNIAVMNTFISLANRNVALYEQNAVLRDPLEILQNLQYPTVPEYFIGRTRKMEPIQMSLTQFVSLMNKMYKRYEVDKSTGTDRINSLIEMMERNKEQKSRKQKEAKENHGIEDTTMTMNYEL